MIEFLLAVDPAVLTVLAGFLVSMGAGMRWMYTSITKSQNELQAKHDKLYHELKQSLHDQIERLEQSNSALARRIDQYSIYVGTLRGIMQASGITHIPAMEVYK